MVPNGLDVHIEAVGAGTKSGDYLFAYAWIIDAKSRELVWSMEEEGTEPVRGSKWLRRYEDDLSLQRGAYELHFYSGPLSFFSGNSSSDDLGDLLKGSGDWLGNNKDSWVGDSRLRGLSKKYHVLVTSDGELKEGDGLPRPPAAVSILHPGNDAYEQSGFSLSQEMELDVYALGEYSEASEVFVDWGWIMDARTRRRVWEMDHDNTDDAGGADKNRRFHDRITLPKGDYIAYYVSDDSHTYDDWNAAPPYDPEAWGLQISPANPGDKGKITPYKDTRSDHPLLKLTGIGDHELRSAAFELSRPAPLRLYAIGEYDRYGERMADYGWVVHLSDNRKVWTMSGDNTSPAGGAAKNRQFDGVVDFDAGDYVVYYTSDGSHSYGGGWNASPPHDQKAYGISVYPGTPDFDPSIFREVDQESIHPPGVLVSITSVGNDKQVEKHFTLGSPTRVRVHAEGEGTRGGMVDYGWIEDRTTGDVVWEMTYRKTSHAGGAEKNRLVDQVILLDKGEYVVHYETDDSHGFGDWNADPPDDPMAWGITVTKADKDSN
ncbi:MAG: hypothetical protein HY304_02865 [candidate division Zixibacteria bacterium]|nr:hypothetical protein [candidate division Zixibacteria bacterium]